MKTFLEARCFAVGKKDTLPRLHPKGTGLWGDCSISNSFILRSLGVVSKTSSTG